MPYTVTKTIRSKKPLYAALAVLLVLVGAGVVFFQIRQQDNRQQQVTDSGNTSQTVDLSPATEDEIQDSNDKKEESAKPEQTTPEQPGTSSNPTAVMPVIVDASQYGANVEVRAYVPGVIEDGGTCTAEFSKGGKTVTKKSAGVADATVTRCTNFSFAATELSAGTWQVKILYESAKAKGDSITKEFEVK